MFKALSASKRAAAFILSASFLLTMVQASSCKVAGSASAPAAVPTVSLDFEETYQTADGLAYYSSAAENWSAGNGRGSHTEMAEQDGNSAVRLTYDTENNHENYNANAVLNLYDPAAKSKFVGTAGVTYTITFDYKVEETDGKELQLFIAPSNRSTGYPNENPAFAGTDMGPKAVMPNRETAFTAASDVIREKTDEWVKVSVEYTAQTAVDGQTVYPILLLQTNGKAADATHTGDTYASVLIDNIEIAEPLAAPEPIELNFEETYQDINGSDYYSSAAENWSAGNGRGSHAEMAEQDGNTAVRLTYDAENNNENYNANGVLSLYDPAAKSKFVGTAGVTYTITFDYKVEETDGKELQLFIAPSNRSTGYPNENPAFAGTDMGPKAVMPNRETAFTAASDVIREKTDEWVKVSVEYTAQTAVDGQTVYPILLLQTNGKAADATHTGDRAYASVLIDNIQIKEPERVLVTCHDYDGSDRTLYVYSNTTFGELAVPTREGYFFDGWYTDASYTKKAGNEELVSDYTEIYAHWLGDGSAMTPQTITDYLTVTTTKSVSSCALDTSSLGESVRFVRNSMLDAAGSGSVSDFYGSYVLSSEEAVANDGEKLVIDNIQIVSPSANTVLFYVELPDYERTNAAWGLGLGDRGICIKQGTAWIWTDTGDGDLPFAYAMNNEWVESTISADGVFTGLPAGYKGYIRIDLSALTYGGVVDFEEPYVFNCLELRFNGFGAENGDAVLGGLFYFPENQSDSTVMLVDGLYYELSRSDEAIVVNPYDAYKEGQSSFSTRYAGTAAEPGAAFADAETSAFWGTAPAGITTASGEAETTMGYMNTYINAAADIQMQPGVDTLMFYVEMPAFTESSTAAGLKLLDSEIKQGDIVRTLSFSNSLYQYAAVGDASWKIARAGADGDLFAIPFGFKGYIKVDVKQFKNIHEITEINWAEPYLISKFEIGFNHVGGENGALVIGGVYAVVADSSAPFIKHGITGETLCFKVIPGDFDCDGTYDEDDVALIERYLGGETLDLSAAARLRETGIDEDTLAAAKAVSSGEQEVDLSVSLDNGAVYEEIFSSDVPTSKEPIVYGTEDVTDPAAVIEADTALNSDPKALAFAQEIADNTIGDFEKTGIDKMCHVSTFVYAKGNIYMSYYANTISAAENPEYQVARLAYAPEDTPADKVILDIMQVGDDLYGHKVTGVYDTILMQKEDEPDNLYILWTASINGKYYRLYQIFNMETEELGEIGVNKFKVGDITNDFSSSGMQNALTANGIGYKTFFNDIGIMQKLSTRVENGEIYYYTGSYSGNFTCLIKSRDLITWEYVAQPNEGANGTGFANATKWENAVYVLNDKAYYFVRQCDPSEQGGSEYGILTYYDLNTGEWAEPVLVGDCQSRSDFIYYDGRLFLFYAPTDREHIGILEIDTNDLAQTKVVLQADMNGSCFYPFVQYNSDGELCMSYTVNRQHIRLASFTLSNYIEKAEPHEHDYEHHDRVEAACEKTGLEEYYSCKTCGKVFDKEKNETTLSALVIPAVGHQFTDAWSSDDTSHWHSCAVCGKKAETGAHAFQWVTDKEATASESGSRHEECEICGYKKAAVEIPATGESRPEENEPSTPGTTTDTDAGETGTTSGADANVPHTGDASRSLLTRLTLLALASAGLIGVILYTKKRKAA